MSISNQPLHAPVSTPLPEIHRWELVPPHGACFKNETGSNVSLTFPDGMEAEVFQSLQFQLNRFFTELNNKKNSKVEISDTIPPPPFVDSKLLDTVREIVSEGDQNGEVY